VFRFSGYELDPLRAELRGPDGIAIKLRPKTVTLDCGATTRMASIPARPSIRRSVAPAASVTPRSSSPVATSGITAMALESAIASEPDNLDLKLALATLQLRGVQMLWYGPAGRHSIETGLKSIRSLLDYALGTKPNYIPVMDAHCRFLNTTNQFVENLIACAKTLSFDPWNGVALYHLGLAQLYLGRFEDALATFDRRPRPAYVCVRWRP
jgi:hypothetical protein